MDTSAQVRGIDIHCENNVNILHASIGIPWAREEHLVEASEFCSSGMTMAKQGVWYMYPSPIDE